MKLAILGDTHFGGGYSLGRIDPYRQLNSRLLDHANTMGHVVDYCADNDVAALVITGDVFEHRRPEASQMAIFSGLLSRLTDIDVHTHIVVGNHDLIRAHKTTTIDVLKNLRLSHVHVWTEIDSTYIPDPRGGTGVNLIFMPFRTRQMLQCSTNEKAVSFLEDRVKFEVRAVEHDGPVIVIGHFSLQGAKSQGSALDSHIISEVVLPTHIFKEGIDAVVMGHIHQHQIISKEPFILHLGSMERSDFGETKDPKYFLVVDTDTLKEPSYEFHPLPVRPLYDITIDQASFDSDSQNLMKHIKNQIKDYADFHKMTGSIVRVEIVVNDRIVSDVNTSEISKMLKNELGVYYCVGVFTTVVTKRQLRSSEITERLDPKLSFSKWLEMEDDSDLRGRLQKAGNQIIEEFGEKK